MIDCCTATVQELQAALENGKITSVEIVENCLAQIQEHNTRGRALHALISTPTFAKATAIAAVLDNERRNGITRSPLHGIPIIIKDNILTSSELGMETTGGSIALVGSKSSRNATLVDRLLQAGMIVLGKANLTEFAGLKTSTMKPGWSALGGQTQSPFVDGGVTEEDGLIGHSSPAGSSSGSAVGVAAGFAPLALGTETIGSVVLPAGRAGIYAFRAGFGTVPMDGVLHLTPDIDMIGAFGRCTRDLAELASYLLDRPDLLALRPAVSWGERTLSVAFADPREWKLGKDMLSSTDADLYDQQQIEAYESAVARVEGELATTYPVKLPDASAIVYEEGGERYGIVAIAFHQLRDTITNFLQSFDECKVRSLDELIAYNNAHPDQAFDPTACPNQDDLLKIQADNSSPEVIARALAHIKKTGREGLDEVFSSQKVNLIAAPADSMFAVLAASAGYPAGVVPFPKVLEPIGRPFGLAIVTKPGRESDLFRFMATWERYVCPPSQRPVPSLLKMREKKGSEDAVPVRGRVDSLEV